MGTTLVPMSSSRVYLLPVPGTVSSVNTGTAESQSIYTVCIYVMYKHDSTVDILRASFKAKTLSGSNDVFLAKNCPFLTASDCFS